MYVQLSECYGHSVSLNVEALMSTKKVALTLAVLAYCGITLDD